MFKMLSQAVNNVTDLLFAISRVPKSLKLGSNWIDPKSGMVYPLYSLE